MTRLQLAALAGMLVLISGCSNTPEQVAKTPRPVEFVLLSNNVPQSTQRVAGSVSAWKTEQIGFEVPGRVKWVREPGGDIEGRLRAEDGKTIYEGTLLAQLDSHRYELAVAAAEANVEIARRRREAVNIGVTTAIPAGIRSAESQLRLATIEFERAERLRKSGTIQQAEFDQAESTLATSRARLAEQNASLKMREAELLSAEAEIKQAEQQLKEAQVDLDDCSLYSAFRGQVAATHVVPGSLVSQESPVLTVQLMDPIRIEVEVSAQQSRRLQPKGRLPVVVTMPSGERKSLEAYIYLIDPSADPLTRTFTVTLLMMNRKVEMPVPESLRGSQIARTKDLWRLDFEFLPYVADDVFYAEQGSIRQDDQGYFVWLVTNRKAGSEFAAEDAVLKVKKLRITPGQTVVPFLGNWRFRTIKVKDKEVKIDTAIIAGSLAVAGGDSEKWDGEEMLLDGGGRWMLRPGDLIQVNLGGAPQLPGMYVPLSAIYEDSGRTFIFTIDETASPHVAKRIEVTTAAGDIRAGTSRRIEGVATGSLKAGMKVITAGVHFLQDGEPVNAAPTGSTK